MDPGDFRLKLAVVRELKALRLNVGKLCKRDTKLARARTTPAAAGQVFGVPLVELVANGPTETVDSLTVPRLIAEITRTVRNNLTKEGLFRVNGSSTRMKQAQAEIDAGGHVTGNLHDQTGLLKLYLRKLPEPLLTYQLYEAFIHAYKIQDLEIQESAILMLCLLLPKEHLHTLSFLLRLFQEIARQENTQMTVDALASILAPNLMHPLHDSAITSPRELANHGSVVGITALLIEHADQIGSVPVSVLETAQQLDDATAQADFQKAIAGRRRRRFKLFRRRRQMPRNSGAVSVKTLNLLKQSERAVRDQRSPSLDRRMMPQSSTSSAVQYSRVLTLRSSTDTPPSSPSPAPTKPSPLRHTS